ncbi:MAG: methyltransferase domain-containing protein [bacterium]
MSGAPRGGNELITANIFEKLGITAGMKVGDFGCGNLGYFAFPPAKIVGKDGIVYAVDILKSVLQSVDQIAKQQGYDNVRTVWSNLEIVGATKIPAGTLDVAALINVLFQSDKDELVFQEIKRLLKSGGKMMVVDWKSITTPFGPPMADRIKKEEVIAHGNKAGLTVIEEFEAGPYHYGVIFVK